ncbi:hypothetical protein ANCCEY_13145 [Ancylostoma ceylanicum]|uniref:Protein kinase domain-containing protein n=1 Tax=Ancylostoma ceylanicum TaxID=53326 RepID=A0A0D6L866_9BILA|nr:hypothetical protein ANCCEY_13145 [Ancylostoma ceylanicum]
MRKQLRNMGTYESTSLLPQAYLLWTAPEILRSSNSGKSKEADIYSFGIICAQVVTQSPPWDLDNRKEDPEGGKCDQVPERNQVKCRVSELIYMIKKGGHNAPRPPLDVQENGDVNQALFSPLLSLLTVLSAQIQPDLGFLLYLVSVQTTDWSEFSSDAAVQELCKLRLRIVGSLRRHSDWRFAVWRTHSEKVS